MNGQPTETTETLIRVGPSTVHGTGVFAAQAIPADTKVGVYEGDPTDADGTHVLWIESDDGGWDGIDGTGPLRFLNHSRSPNVEFDGADLFALRHIEADEELFFDYGEEWAHVP